MSAADCAAFLHFEQAVAEKVAQQAQRAQELGAEQQLLYVEGEKVLHDMMAADFDPASIRHVDLFHRLHGSFRNPSSFDKVGGFWGWPVCFISGLFSGWAVVVCGVCGGWGRSAQGAHEQRGSVPIPSRHHRRCCALKRRR